MWELYVADREKVLPTLPELAEKAQTEHGVTIRKMSRRHLRRELDDFARIYNAAWSKNWGFVPYSKEDLAALALEYLLALLLGIASALRRGSFVDHAVRVVTLLLFSQPLFWLGLMAVLLFSYVWPVLPASHMLSVDADLMSPAERLLDLARHLFLPSLVMGLGTAGGTARFLRASLIEVMSQDYIRAARAKGLSERRVVWVHGLRNAIVPVIQVFAIQLPLLLSGALIVEVVFSWPGLGQLTFLAISTRDYPLILGATALSAALVILGNLLADVLHALVDPRVRDAQE
jgi:peptide/nickel transport system permease protein